MPGAQVAPGKRRAHLTGAEPPTPGIAKSAPSGGSCVMIPTNASRLHEAAACDCPVAMAMATTTTTTTATANESMGSILLMIFHPTMTRNAGQEKTIQTSAGIAAASSRQAPWCEQRRCWTSGLVHKSHLPTGTRRSGRVAAFTETTVARLEKLRRSIATRVLSHKRAGADTRPVRSQTLGTRRGSGTLRCVAR